MVVPITFPYCFSVLPQMETLNILSNVEASANQAHTDQGDECLFLQTKKQLTFCPCTLLLGNIE